MKGHFDHQHLVVSNLQVIEIIATITILAIAGDTVRVRASSGNSNSNSNSNSNNNTYYESTGESDSSCDGASDSTVVGRRDSRKGKILRSNYCNTNSNSNNNSNNSNSNGNSSSDGDSHYKWDSDYSDSGSDSELDYKTMVKTYKNKIILENNIDKIYPQYNFWYKNKCEDENDEVFDRVTVTRVFRKNNKRCMKIDFIGWSDAAKTIEIEESDRINIQLPSDCEIKIPSYYDDLSPKNTHKCEMSWGNLTQMNQVEGNTDCDCKFKKYGEHTRSDIESNRDWQKILHLGSLLNCDMVMLIVIVIKTKMGSCY